MATQGTWYWSDAKRGGKSLSLSGACRMLGTPRGLTMNKRTMAKLRIPCVSSEDFVSAKLFTAGVADEEGLAAAIAAELARRQSVRTFTLTMQECLPREQRRSVALLCRILGLRYLKANPAAIARWPTADSRKRPFSSQTRLTAKSMFDILHALCPSDPCLLFVCLGCPSCFW
jgi:hypothetical protein